MNKQEPSAITVAVIGESGVGKTTFIDALTAGEGKQTDVFSAVGVVVRKRSILIGRGLVRLTFWDIAGCASDERERERQGEAEGLATTSALHRADRRQYRARTPQNRMTGYLQNLDVKKVDGFILMYGVYRWDTFGALLDSVDALQAHLGGKPALIVGNKFRNRAALGAEVPQWHGKVLAEGLRAHFFEIDALDGNKVREVVQNWTNEVLSVMCTRKRPLKTAVDEYLSLQTCFDIPSSIPSVTRYGHHRHFKVILVGNSEVGKTSFVRRLVTGKFQETQRTTPPFDIVRHDIDVVGHTVKLQIWDTAAQERFHTMPEQYYRRAEGAIVMYDITCKESYVDASKWAAEIKKKSSTQPVLVVVASKHDLSELRKVKAKDGKKLAHSLSSSTMTVDFFEVSAKTGYFVLNAVRYLALEMMRAEEDGEVHDVYQLQSHAGQQQKRNCCST